MHKIIFSTILGLVTRVVLSPAFLEWAIRYSARKLAEYTDTPHDDAFVAKIEEILDSKQESN